MNTTIPNAFALFSCDIMNMLKVMFIHFEESKYIFLNFANITNCV